MPWPAIASSAYSCAEVVVACCCSSTSGGRGESGGRGANGGGAVSLAGGMVGWAHAVAVAGLCGSSKAGGCCSSSGSTSSSIGPGAEKLDLRGWLRGGSMGGCCSSSAEEALTDGVTWLPCRRCARDPPASLGVSSSSVTTLRRGRSARAGSGGGLEFEMEPALADGDGDASDGSLSSPERGTAIVGEESLLATKSSSARIALRLALMRFRKACAVSRFSGSWCKQSSTKSCQNWLLMPTRSGVRPLRSAFSIMRSLEISKYGERSRVMMARTHMPKLQMSILLPYNGGAPSFV